MLQQLLLPIQELKYHTHAVLQQPPAVVALIPVFKSLFTVLL
jgi:hypothetical protein